MAGRVAGQGRLHHRRRPRPGPQPRDPAGPGGRRHHRRRRLRGHRPGIAVRRRHRGRPGRDGQAGRGARPADRRQQGRRPRLRGAEGGRRRRRGPARPARHRLRQRRHRLLAAALWELDDDSLADDDRHQPDRRLAHRQGRDPAPDRGDNGGSIILTSSAAGPARACAEHRPLRRGQARRRRPHAHAGLELAQHSIRVNSIHPTQVDTPMIQNEATVQAVPPGPRAPDQRPTSSRPPSR